MFLSNRLTTTNLNCGFRVNTKSPDWQRSMRKILKKIKGGNVVIDVVDEEGIAYVSITGQGDPNKLLKLMGSKSCQDAQMVFVKTGTNNHHQDPNYYNYQNPYFGQSSTQYCPSGYYPQAQAMQPYYQQHPFPYGYGRY